MSIFAPVHGQVLAGAILVQALFDAADGEVRYVDLHLDGASTIAQTVELQPSQAMAEVHFVVDTTALIDGPHLFTVKAYRKPGRSVRVGEATVRATVDNATSPGPDITPPAVTILNPNEDQRLRGNQQIVEIQVGDNRSLLIGAGAEVLVTLAGVEVKRFTGIDPSYCNSTGLLCTLSFSINIANVPNIDPNRNPDMPLVVQLVDPAGNQGGAGVQVSVRNNTGPQVSILSPVNRSLVSGSIVIEVAFDATPDKVRYLDLHLNDSVNPIATVDLGRQGRTNGTVQFTVDLNGLTILDGLHRFTVMAYQKPGRSRRVSEDTVELMVNNTLLHVAVPVAGSYLALTQSILVQVFHLPIKVESFTLQVFDLSGSLVFEKATPNYVFADPGDFLTWETTLTLDTLPLPEGPATLTVRADSQSPWPLEDIQDTIPVYIDNTLPKIIIAHPQGEDEL